uniref:Transcriptional regulator n=1 Tax=Heterorhabditis bacteriophora TaxID=37862 RepID=A0A1I7W9D1_HETBA
MTNGLCTAILNSAFNINAKSKKVLLCI